jgi:hypothetical protein
MERRRNGFRVCLALAAILSCIIGRDVLFAGRTFTPTDFLNSRAPWGAEHSSDVSIRNRIQQDVVEFDAMHALAAGESLRRGRLFLWNPRILCGVPSLGDPQLGTFYPPRLILLRLLPPLLALDLLTLIHFLGAGLAMYALARTWGLGAPAAITSSLIWMLCGHQMVWFKCAGGLPPAVFLPLLALALRRGVTEHSFPWIAGAGAAWAFLLLGSHPLMSFIALVWTAVFLGSQARAVGGRWTCWAALLFGAVAAGLGAIQLFPFLETLAASQKVSVHDSLIYSRPARVPLLLVTLFWQRALGSPIDRVDLTNAWTGSNFFEFQAYMGLLPLLLAGAAWRRSRVLTATALALLTLATIYPLWRLVVMLLPFLEMLDPHRLPLFAFAVSMLAGLGLEELLEKPPGSRLLAGAAVIAGGVVLVGLVGTARSATWLALGNPAYFALVIATLGAAAALRVLRSSAAPSLKAAAVWMAIAADLLPGFLLYNASYDPLPPEPAAIRRLPRDERVLVDIESPHYRAGVGNYLMAYGCSTPSGYVSQFPRVYGELVQALGGRADDHRIEFPAEERRGLRALNVAAILTVRGEERIDPIPRAWLVGRCEILPGAAERLRRISDPSFDPAEIVILETPVPPLSTPPSGSVAKTGEQEYAADCDRTCLLVVSETYDAGWRCEIDGRRQPILRANHAQRAVVLKSGRHRVAFSYHPLSLSLGAGTTAATLGVLLGWALLRRARRNPALTARSG